MDTQTLERMNRAAPKADDLVRGLKDVTRADIAIVGGKNASLGEMINQLQGAGIRVPDGFATTAAAYWMLLEANDLTGRLSQKLAELKDDLTNLAAIGEAARQMILDAELPSALADAITSAYRELAQKSGRERLTHRKRQPFFLSHLPRRARRDGGQIHFRFGQSPVGHARVAYIAGGNPAEAQDALIGRRRGQHAAGS